MARRRRSEELANIPRPQPVLGVTRRRHSEEFAKISHFPAEARSSTSPSSGHRGPCGLVPFGRVSPSASTTAALPPLDTSDCAPALLGEGCGAAVPPELLPRHRCPPVTGVWTQRPRRWDGAPGFKESKQGKQTGRGVEEVRVRKRRSGWQVVVSCASRCRGKACEETSSPLRQSGSRLA